MPSKRPEPRKIMIRLFSTCEDAIRAANESNCEWVPILLDRPSLVHIDNVEILIETGRHFAFLEKVDGTIVTTPVN